MSRTKVYLLFLMLFFCLCPKTVDAIGIGSFQAPGGYLLSRADSGVESVRFLTDNGYEEIEGRHSSYRYHTNSRKPYSAQRILEHYMGLLKNSGGKIVRVENTSLNGQSFTGKVSINGEETWISVEVKDLRNYDVSMLERRVSGVYIPDSAQNTQEMLDKAEAVALLNIVDRTGELQLDVSFRPGNAGLTSIPPQFKKIASMMMMDSSYSFRVEAPVDIPPMGNAEERRLLMKARQTAIYDALVASGAPSSRLTTEYPVDETPKEITRARIVLR